VHEADAQARGAAERPAPCPRSRSSSGPLLDRPQVLG